MSLGGEVHLVVCISPIPTRRRVRGNMVCFGRIVFDISWPVDAEGHDRPGSLGSIVLSHVRVRQLHCGALQPQADFVKL